MKRVLLLTSVLLTLGASAALAGGTSLNWGSGCYTEAPQSAQNFACDTNAGSWDMVVSFVIDTEITDMVGVEITMERFTLCDDSSPPGHCLPGWEDYSMPDWWKLGSTTGDCRAGRMTLNADFSTAPKTACVDWTGGRAYTQITYGWGANASPPLAAWEVRIIGGTAIYPYPPYAPFDCRPGVEYYAGKLTITNDKTVGAGACAGCSRPFAWHVGLLTVAGLDGTRVDLYTTRPGGNRIALWNPPAVVPAHNTSWGQIKSLYR